MDEHLLDVLRCPFCGTRLSLVENEALVKWYQGRTPSRRFGEVEEVAGLAVLLASPSGGYINGQTIAVDGGHPISFH